MKKDIFVENFIKEIEDKRKREKRSKIKKISIFITVILLIAFAGFMVFAFPNGIERPTYCLDCEKNNVHDPDDILDYHEYQGYREYAIAGFQIYKNNEFLAKTNEETKLEYAMIGDTLKFKDYSNDAELFTFQYETPSGEGNKVFKKTSKSTFENISLKLTEAGTYTFFLTVQKGENNNWNGEHVVLGCNSEFPNGVYTFFVRINIVVKAPSLNVEYYTDNINSPIKKNVVVFDGEQLTYNSADKIYNADYYVDDDIPRGYIYDNKWDLYMDSGEFLYSGTTETNVRPGYDLTYLNKTVKVKVEPFTPTTKPIDVKIEYRLNSKDG